MELTTLDYSYLVREWQTLVGGKIQKVYLKDRLHFISIYHGTLSALLLGDRVAFLSDAKIAWPREPSGYCLFLRRRLTNARIRAIRQQNSDRIIAIELDTKEGPATLLAEILGDINTMLIRDNTIISCLTTHSYADRTIRGGIAYEPPPTRASTFENPDTNIAGKEAAKTFAVAWGLGGMYAEELCARAGIERKATLTVELIERAAAALIAMRNEPIRAVVQGEQALPFPFLSKPESESWESASSFNAAIDRVLRGRFETHEQHEEQQVVRAQLTKQEKILSSQRAHLEKLEAAVTAEQRKGELLYEHYTVIKELLAALQSDWKKMPLGAIRDKYGTHPLIKQINEDGTIELELGE